MPVTVREALALPVLAAGDPVVLGGDSGLDADIRWVHVSEVRDIGALLVGDELVLTTGLGMAASAEAAVDFVDQSYFPGALHIHVVPTRLGKSSYTLDQLVTQNGRPVAYAQATMVCVVKDKAVPIPDALRDIVISWMGKS